MSSTNVLPVNAHCRGRKPKHTLDAIKQKINVDTPCIPTFHFHFSDDIVERFTYFATLHRFDERKVYKENWNKWIAEEDVAESISAEIDRLQVAGYTGDILDKMFKSVRYYYRKKPFEPAPPKTRKTYEAFPPTVLQSIDDHIFVLISRAQVSPATAFADYRAKHPVDDATEAKYKKTYKNRFFLFTKRLREMK